MIIIVTKSLQERKPKNSKDLTRYLLRQNIENPRDLKYGGLTANDERKSRA